MESLSLVRTPEALDYGLTEHRHEPVERLADGLETSSRDHRLYRVVELRNKLKAALIHDAETDIASVTMNINVGSMSDDEDMPGIAHAVECGIPFPTLRILTAKIEFRHVLFLGTKTVCISENFSMLYSSPIVPAKLTYNSTHIRMLSKTMSPSTPGTVVHTLRVLQRFTPSK
jgi:hypothetical protein